MNCSRYPVDVKAVGVMQCQKQKNYMVFVFHKDLKRKFPIESGSLRRSDRTIPKFKGKEAKSSVAIKDQQTGKLNRSLERLKLLEAYSQELLKMDAKISQSEGVIQFFKAQTQDLDPSFPENSVVIMPSEIGGERKKQPQQHPPSITLPQASQSYRCIETFETKDTKNKTFKVAKKEIVEVLIKDMSGWWLVENADKQIAWFPAPYLEKTDIHKDIQNKYLPLLSPGGFPEAAVQCCPREPATCCRCSLPVPPQAVCGEALTELPVPGLGTVSPSLSPVPVRPSAHEILQRCSTLTKRAMQQSASQPALLALHTLQSVQ
uniref:NADPH oxidase organizer 1 n=1 Tax=Apteryx owenii TaxID=8824 RepID=A0A8B9P8Q0_APTOW